MSKGWIVAWGIACAALGCVSVDRNGPTALSRAEGDEPHARCESEYASPEARQRMLPAQRRAALERCRNLADAALRDARKAAEEE